MGPGRSNGRCRTLRASTQETYSRHLGSELQLARNAGPQTGVLPFLGNFGRVPKTVGAFLSELRKPRKKGSPPPRKKNQRGTPKERLQLGSIPPPPPPRSNKTSPKKPKKGREPWSLGHMFCLLLLIAYHLKTQLLPTFWVAWAIDL